MRYRPIKPELYVENRSRLAKLLLPNSLVAVNSNDVLPINADGTLPFRQSSDLFYLCGIDQEQTILLLYPEAHEQNMREILFIRETNDLLATWEGHKFTKEEARRISGIERVEWLSQFRPLFHRLMCECDHVYLNTNEHKRAVIEVQTRE
ncbi:MAG TPA: aminopeptidase P N-terminal domain-containing protein, partial [Verrucomicrobiae bacterium]|nr:aminopeptidase P N-terminal domain-containing protein [Verrucomicrobiae bacterium]